jgi:aspartate/methionine/tyrosine aminotransferase
MNPLLADIPPSLIRELNARKRPDSIDFGLGEPTFAPELASFEAAMAWVAAHGCPYSPNPGFHELREAIARHYALPDLDRAEHVCVTNGSQEALYLAIKALLAPGTDEVLVVSPSYPLYAKLCQMEGIAVREVSLSAEDGFRPDAERVLAALSPRTRLVVLGSPSNPTGRTWPTAELARLARGLAARPGQPVWVLSDEVYREIYYAPEPPDSIARHYPHALVANSLSKSNALTGMRLGWLLGPSEVMAGVIKVHQFITTAASTFSQRLALALFQEPGALARMRERYGPQRAELLAALERAGLRHVPPDGAFYCLVRLPDGAPSLETALSILAEANVVTIPGVAFGAEGWLRLSFVAPLALIGPGVERMAGAIAARRPA